MKIIEEKTPTQSEWDCLYQADPLALPFTRSDVLNAISSMRSWRNASTLFIFDDGQQVLLPMVGQGVGWATKYAALPHFWGWGGIISAMPFTAEHAGCVLQALSKKPSVRLDLLTEPMRGGMWDAAEMPANTIVRPATSYLIDLSEGYEAAFKKYSRSTRRSVKIGRRTGVSFEEGTSERNVKAMQSLLLAAIDKWAEDQNEPAWLYRYRQRHSLDMKAMLKMCRLSGGAYRLLVGYLDNTPVVATNFYIGKHAYGMRMALDHTRANRSNARDLVVDRMVQISYENGAKSFDLGPSDPDSTTSIYKSRFTDRALDHATIVMSPSRLHLADRLLRDGVKKTMGVRDFKVAKDSESNK